MSGQVQKNLFNMEVVKDESPTTVYVAQEKTQKRTQKSDQKLRAQNIPKTRDPPSAEYLFQIAGGERILPRGAVGGVKNCRYIASFRHGLHDLSAARDIYNRLNNNELMVAAVVSYDRKGGTDPKKDSLWREPIHKIFAELYVLGEEQSIKENNARMNHYYFDQNPFSESLAERLQDLPKEVEEKIKEQLQKDRTNFIFKIQKREMPHGTIMDYMPDWPEPDKQKEYAQNHAKDLEKMFATFPTHLHGQDVTQVNF